VTSAAVVWAHICSSTRPQLMRSIGVMSIRCSHSACVGNHACIMVAQTSQNTCGTAWVSSLSVPVARNLARNGPSAPWRTPPLGLTAVFVVAPAGGGAITPAACSGFLSTELTGPLSALYVGLRTSTGLFCGSGGADFCSCVCSMFS